MLVRRAGARISRARWRSRQDGLQLAQAMDVASDIARGGELIRELSRVPLPRLLTRAEQFVFVGRRDERAVLDARGSRRARCERRVVLLAGEPGAGKTRLASEFARAAYDDGALVLGGRCDEAWACLTNRSSRRCVGTSTTPLTRTSSPCSALAR